MEGFNVEIIFLPLWLPPLTFAISTSMQFLSVSALVLAVHGEGAPELWGMLAGLSGLTLLMSIFCGVKFIRSANEMIKTFREFKLENTQCMREEDKRTVIYYIETTWDGNDESFESFVQNELADYIAAQFCTPKAVVLCLFGNSACVLFWYLILILKLLVAGPLVLLIAFAQHIENCIV